MDRFAADIGRGEGEDIAVQARNTEPVMTPYQIEEDWHGRMAVEIGRLLNIFPSSTTSWDLGQETTVQNAEPQDFCKLQVWRKQLENEVIRRNSLTLPEEGQHTPSNSSSMGRPSVTVIDEDDDVTSTQLSETDALLVDHTTTELQSVPTSSNADVIVLNAEQQQACDILAWHLDETLANRDPPPLRMINQGEGGTGELISCFGDPGLMVTSVVYRQIQSDREDDRYFR
jgi:hypothetical protein